MTTPGTPATPVRSLPSRIAGRVLRMRPIGMPLSRASHALGLNGLSRWASRHSGFVPPIVDISAGFGETGTAGARMHSAEGNDHIVRSIWYNGLGRYEAPLPRLYARLVRGSGHALDVGANSGLYAILATSSDPDVRVSAFEPLPDALRWLRSNLELNGVSGRVEVVEGAAGDSEGTFNLYVPEKRFGDTLETSASLESDFRPRHHAVIEVKVKTLDAHVRERGIRRVGVLRADVEGAEYKVLTGAHSVLKEHRPLVFVEVLSIAAAERLREFPASADYLVYCLEERRIVGLPRVECVPEFTNQLWCPRERLHELAAAAAHLGMTLSPAPTTSYSP